MRSPLADPRVREPAKRLAFRLGVGRPLRAVRRAVLETDAERRDREDNERLLALMADVLPPDGRCVDVGAHLGTVVEEAVRLAPAGRHVAFEPLPDLAARLAARLPQVEVHALALSDEPGEREFVHVTTLPGWSGFKERPYPGRETVERIRVPTARLDDVLDPDVAPALLKVDVEGAEREVLLGASRILAAHRPVVVFEHGLGSADFYDTTPRHLWEILVERAGLRLGDLEGGGPYSREGFEREFAARRRVNFVARP